MRAAKRIFRVSVDTNFENFNAQHQPWRRASVGFMCVPYQSAKKTLHMPLDCPVFHKNSFLQYLYNLDGISQFLRSKIKTQTLSYLKPFKYLQQQI